MPITQVYSGQRARQECDEFVANYNHVEFLKDCVQNSRLVIENTKEGTACLAEESLKALAARTPFMMLRRRRRRGQSAALCGVNQ